MILSLPIALTAAIFLLPSIDIKILIPAKTNPAIAADNEIVFSLIIENNFSNCISHIFNKLKINATTIIDIILCHIIQ